MIDNSELRAIRQRYETAQKAADAVYVHASDGLFGELPAEEAPPLLTSAVASVKDVRRLIAEVERLSPAAYVHGLEACRERECGHVDWEADPDATCPEVEERVATLDDVKRAGYLDTLAQALRRAAEMAKAGEPVDERNLAEVVIQAVDNTYDRISQWESTGEESAW